MKALQIAAAAAAFSGAAAVAAASPAIAPPRQDHAQSDWRQYGFDGGQSGDYPHEKSIKPKNVSRLQLAASGGPAIQSPGLILGGGAIYTLSYDGNLYALNATDFSVIWSTPEGIYFGDATPALAGKTLVTPCYGSIDGDNQLGLCGLKAATGKPVWNSFCDNCSLINNPSVDGDLAFYQYNVEAGTAGTVYLAALNTKTGKIAWQYGQPYHCPDNGLGGSVPVPVANGHVYAPLGCQGAQQNENQICALEETTGTPDWCTDYNDQYAEDIVANGTVYVTTGGLNQVMALDAATGAVKWTTTLPDTAFARVAAKDMLYVSLARDQGIYALSAATGAVVWGPQVHGNGFGGMNVANGVVYAVASGNAVAALDGKTGAYLWQSAESNGGGSARPIIVNDTVYGVCYTLCAYRLP